MTPAVPVVPVHPGGSVHPVDLVVEGCTALVHVEDPARPGQAPRVQFVEDATFSVTDGVITAVETGRRPGEVPARDRMDGRRRALLPGLVNCHTHAAMVLFRGAAEDVPLDRWFNERIWPMEVNLTPDDVELGARLAAAEMIRAGVTTFADHYFAMDRVAAVVEETGLRANLGSTYFSSQGPAERERSLGFALEHRGRAGGRITTALAPHATYTVDAADLAATAELAAEHDLPVHVHAAEFPEQTRASLAATGATPIELLRRAGLLEARTIVAHGTGIVPEDVPALTAARRTGVASAPKGYLKHGRATTPIRLLVAAGVPVGLATDGAASNNTLDVWESMLFTSLVQKSVEGDPAWMPAVQVLDHATRQGAEVLGLGGVTGRIAVGHRADLVLVDLTAPHLQPVHDLAQTLVLSARSSDVVTTVVDGQVLMRERVLLTVDVHDVVARLTPRLAELTERGHGRTLQEYSP